MKICSFVFCNFLFFPELTLILTTLDRMLSPIGIDLQSIKFFLVILLSEQSGLQFRDSPLFALISSASKK